MTIGSRITEAREAKGISQSALAKAVGISQPAIAYYEKDVREPKASTLSDIASALDVSVSHLLGVEGAKWAGVPEGTIPGRRGCARHPRPVLGRVAAGEAREACPIPGETIDVDEEMWERCDDGAWVKVAGNSMNRLFPDGAMVYLDLCEHGATVSNGDVAAVFVNGDDITLKRVYFEDGALRLCPESYDPEYRDYVIDESDPNAPDVRFVGKAISFKADPKWRP